MDYTKSFQMFEETKELSEHVYTFAATCKAISKEHQKNKTIVFTSGCFDILHTAHLHFLLYLKRRGDILVVGVDNNNATKKIKGEGRPFFDETERAMMVASLRFIDFVFVFPGIWEVSHLLKLKPHFVGVPSFDPNMDDKLEKISLAGSEVIVTPPFLKAQSSSRQARIIKNDYLISNVMIEVDE